MIEIVWLARKFAKRKIGFEIRNDFFLSLFLKVYCVCIKSWSVRHFWAWHVISYLCIMHACIMQDINFQRLRNMGDQWEAWIDVIKNIQEEFVHDIREIKERLARLTSLFEDYIQTKVVHPRGPSLLPNQRIPRPFTQTMIHLPCETNHPNLRQPTPTASLAFGTTSRPVDQPSGSRGKPSG